MRMAEPGEILYTEGHRYPRSRRTGGKEKLEEGGKQARGRIIELVDKLNKIKDLFNKRDMTGKDEFLEELRDLLSD